jgi:hypothetical protein
MIVLDDGSFYGREAEKSAGEYAAAFYNGIKDRKSQAFEGYKDTT